MYFCIRVYIIAINVRSNDFINIRKWCVCDVLKVVSRNVQQDLD